MEMAKIIEIIIGLASLACMVYLFSGLSDLQDMEKEEASKMIITTVVSRPRQM